MSNLTLIPVIPFPIDKTASVVHYQRDWLDQLENRQPKDQYIARSKAYQQGRQAARKANAS